MIQPKNFNLEFFLNTLEKIEDEILSFACFITNKKEDQWSLNRLQWKKNRFIFEKIFYEKNIPENHYKFLQKKKILDINLFNCWKTWKYRILCSTKVIQGGEIHFPSNGLCRVPLLDRSLYSIYKIEPNSGCICCSNKGGIKEPIWWDNLNKISFFLRKTIEEKASLNMTHINFKKKNENLTGIVQINRLKIVFKKKSCQSFKSNINLKYFFLKIMKTKKKNLLKLIKIWKIFF